MVSGGFENLDLNRTWTTIKINLFNSSSINYLVLLILEQSPNQIILLLIIIVELVLRVIAISRHSPCGYDTLFTTIYIFKGFIIIDFDTINFWRRCRGLLARLL